ncbi:hypothetical protein ACFX2F_029462 [Malus domestica]
MVVVEMVVMGVLVEEKAVVIGNKPPTGLPRLPSPPPISSPTFSIVCNNPGHHATVCQISLCYSRVDSCQKILLAVANHG